METEICSIDRLPPHSQPPDGAIRVVDEDWNRIYFDANNEPMAYEIHELCDNTRCEFHAERKDVQFFLPCKPYSPIDAVNRIAAAQGSVGYAIASANADYNGHRISLSWNGFRGYYIAEYYWGERRVIVRSSDAKEAIAASIREYDRQGLGSSLHIALKPEDAKAAEEFPQLIHGRECPNQPWWTWKHREAGSALRTERQFGVPCVGYLLKANSEDEYKKMVDGEFARRRPKPRD